MKFPITKLFLILCYVTDCYSYFKRSLFVVGEIGGNDYNYAAFAGDITHLPALVPLVVNTITKAIEVCYIQHNNAFI